MRWCLLLTLTERTVLLLDIYESKTQKLDHEIVIAKPDTGMTMSKIRHGLEIKI